MDTKGRKANRLQYLFFADLAAEAERYEDVVEQIKLIIELTNGRLTIEERNLLSVAYKNITNSLRNSWKIVDNFAKQQLTIAPRANKHLVLIRRQRERIEKELGVTCRDIVQLLDKMLLPGAQGDEEIVFYSKMKGDYYRYLAEISHKRERDRHDALSLGAYKIAYKHALSTLGPLHPTRLGLALNFSVFFHDVRKSPERACHLAKSAFDDAVTSLDPARLQDDQFIKDSFVILQFLMDDLILWSTEIQGTNQI